MRPIEEGNI